MSNKTKMQFEISSIRPLHRLSSSAAIIRRLAHFDERMANLAVARPQSHRQKCSRPNNNEKKNVYNNFLWLIVELTASERDDDSRKRLTAARSSRIICRRLTCAWARARARARCRSNEVSGVGVRSLIGAAVAAAAVATATVGLRHSGGGGGGGGSDSDSSNSADSDGDGAQVHTRRLKRPRRDGATRRFSRMRASSGGGGGDRRRISVDLKSSDGDDDGDSDDDGDGALARLDILCMWARASASAAAVFARLWLLSHLQRARARAQVSTSRFVANIPPSSLSRPSATCTSALHTRCADIFSDSSHRLQMMMMTKEKRAPKTILYAAARAISAPSRHSSLALVRSRARASCVCVPSMTISVLQSVATKSSAVSERWHARTSELSRIIARRCRRLRLASKRAFTLRASNKSYKAKHACCQGFRGVFVASKARKNCKREERESDACKYLIVVFKRCLNVCRVTPLNRLASGARGDDDADRCRSPPFAAVARSLARSFALVLNVPLAIRRQSSLRATASTRRR